MGWPQPPPRLFAIHTATSPVSRDRLSPYLARARAHARTWGRPVALPGPTES